MSLKLNLGCGNDVRDQYVNVDLKPCTASSQDSYRQGDVQNLDWLCDNESAEEILALDILSYTPIQKIIPTLQNWSQKLSVNGVLKISVTDIYHIAKMLTHSQMSMRDFLTAVFGTQQDKDYRVSAIDGKTLCGILEECGLTVACKRYDGLFFYLEAVKMEK